MIGRGLPRSDAQLIGKGLEGVDYELDVFAGVHFQELDADGDFFAVYLGGKALGLELLLSALGGQGGDAFGAHQAAGAHKAGQLVAGQEGLVHGAGGADAPLGVVARDGVGQLALPALFEPGHDALGVRLGPLVVVGVVQHAGQAPGFDGGLARAIAQGGGAHHHLDRARVGAQGGRGGPGFEQGPAFFAGEGHLVDEEQLVVLGQGPELVIHQEFQGVGVAAHLS